MTGKTKGTVRAHCRKFPKGSKAQSVGHCIGKAGHTSHDPDRNTKRKVVKSHASHKKKKG